MLHYIRYSPLRSRHTQHKVVNMQKQTIDHWEKYPFWTPERRYLICYLTFGESEPIVQAAMMVQADLRNSPVAISPTESLHQTMPGVATRDELSDENVEEIRESIREQLSGYPPFELEIDGVDAGTEGVSLRMKPKESLENLHRLLHQAVSDGWGHPADCDPGKIYPHISLAYSNGVGDARPLFVAADKYRRLGGRTMVGHVDLVWLRREPDRYAWDLVERFLLRQ